MSTQKWSDDELDDLFRRASEEADPTYDSAAWQDMETRLNNRDRTNLGAKLLRWGLPALLLLLSTGGFIWYIKQSSSDRPVSAAASQKIRESVRADASAQPNRPTGIAGAPVALTPEDPVPNDAAREAREQPAVPGHPVPEISAAPRVTVTPPVKQNASKPLIAVTRTNRSSASVKQPPAERPVLAHKPVGSVPGAGSDSRITAISENPANDGLGRVVAKRPGRVKLFAAKSKFTRVAGYRPRHVNDIARQDATPGGLGRQPGVGSGLITTPNPVDDPRSGGTTGADYYVPASLRAAPTQEDQSITTDRFVWPALQLLTAKGIKWPASPDITAEPVSPVATPASALPRTARTRFYGLSVQLVLSPDLSTVGLKNFDRPGSNLGIAVQYQLSERLSLQGEVLWSTKVYTAQPSEYSSPMYMHILPESITGRCTMFDIPVNLRYDVLLRPGGDKRGPKRWFMSGGVTSYFIDHEAYNFNFKNPNDPGITAKGWDNRAAGRKGGNFGLSNLNVSVGYEQPISRRLSWQLEPFMKIPLKQVGYYKVKLISTGAFLSLRYRL